MLRVAMDIIILGLLLVGIQNLRAVDMRYGLGCRILVLLGLLALLKHYHLIFGATTFL